MTDNGLAALAAALHAIHPGPRPWVGGLTDDEFAAAILGERGVFLPDGLDAVREADTLEIIRLQHEWANANGDAMREQDEYHEEILALKISCDAYAGSFERASATIAQLRADVEREQAFVIAGQARENECEREIATLRAALDLCVETIKWTEGFVLDDAMETWKRGTRRALATAKEAGG